ncbi:hypothetical protein QJS66_23160 [Kocuria rhizophila]|nr:hypothetical protein QJS66_23160 [Kocuria rhizophila]
MIRVRAAGEFLKLVERCLLRRGQLLRPHLRGAADPLARALGRGQQGQPRDPDQQGRPDPAADPLLPRARTPHGGHQPARVRDAQAPDLDIRTYGLTLWDLEAGVAPAAWVARACSPCA